MRGLRPGLVGDAGQIGRPAPVDHRVGKHRGDDLAPEPMSLDLLRIAFLHLHGEVAEQLPGQIGIVGNGAVEQIVVEHDLGIGEQHADLGAGQPGFRLLASAIASSGRNSTARSSRPRLLQLPIRRWCSEGSTCRAARRARWRASGDSCSPAPAPQPSSVISASSLLRFGRGSVPSSMAGPARS
jgi:hypothetical protein